MSIELVISNDAYLTMCATRIHADYDRSLRALGNSIEALLAVGRTLRKARQALPSNQAYGLWFRDQDFGFSRQWANRLCKAAEHEWAVRAALESQLSNGGELNIEAAIRVARAALPQTAQKEPEPVTDIGIATVTPIGGRRPMDERVERVRHLVSSGLNADQIADELGVTRNRVYIYATAAGIPLGKKSRLAIAERVDRIRDLAKQGATSQQIADELDVGVSVIKRYGRDYGVDIPADATTHPHRAIDSTRVVSTAIDALDGIGAMFDHIDYSALPVEEIEGWVNVLKCSIRSLANLKNRLKELTQP